MKEYKVESFLLYSKMTFNTKHIIQDATKKIQELLDQYAQDGWTLASTDAVTFGAAVYHYLYFERNK
ncbi:DUF4177 domain-containing protein [Maribacter sp. 2308TA10-17]|uniref:DUF4177 domain-containing protein n=1 Tax=Maribacter sp. 2308TA10-17 TaxID=3386276 RepID=UPI0039BC4DD1